MKTLLATAAALLIAGPAFANPAAVIPVIAPVAAPITTANPVASANPTGGNTGPVTQDDKTKVDGSVAAALGQAASAGGRCVYEVRLLFGVAQWSSASPMQCMTELATAALGSGNAKAIDAGRIALEKLTATVFPASPDDAAFRQ